MAADTRHSMNDYLAQVYRLCDNQEGGQPREDSAAFVSTSALADLLDVSAPAVNRMVSKLKDMGLLEHEPYQGIRLTDDGRREALKVLRSHRIVEAFLVTVMNFGWHEVHTEADRISRAITPIVVERMAAMAGNPTHCPHGEPIPSPDGVLPPLDDIPLTDAPEKTEQTISRVRTRERDRLEYLAALGLMPGVQLEVLHMAPFHGPIQLRVGKEYRIIGHNLAEMIRVHAS